MTNMRDHRTMYPEQYEHPLVGKRVRTPDGTTGTVERVMASRFGPLAILAEHGPTRAWEVDRCEVIQ